MAGRGGAPAGRGGKTYAGVSFAKAIC